MSRRFKIAMTAFWLAVFLGLGVFLSLVEEWALAVVCFFLFALCLWQELYLLTHRREEW